MSSLINNKSTLNKTFARRHDEDYHEGTIFNKVELNIIIHTLYLYYINIIFIL